MRDYHRHVCFLDAALQIQQVQPRAARGDAVDADFADLICRNPVSTVSLVPFERVVARGRRAADSLPAAVPTLS